MPVDPHGVLLVRRHTDSPTPPVVAPISSSQSPDAATEIVTWGALQVHAHRVTQLALDPWFSGAPSGSTDDAQPPAHLAQPPYARLEQTEQGWRISPDVLGFRQVYRRDEKSWSALSTSAAALQRLSATGLRHRAVAVRASLGWQIGDDTIVDRVTVERNPATLTEHGVVARPYDIGPHVGAGSPCEGDIEGAVRSTAGLLGDLMCAYLDENPDAELQLTGGIDSRILLAAIPRSRRRGVHAMTLKTSTSSDAVIAADLAARFAMHHEINDFSAVERLTPEDAFATCLARARVLLDAADPIAATAVAVADVTRGQRPRIAGLGGEVARGFYYFGPMAMGHVSRARVRRLARWRLFTNESAPQEMFSIEFHAWSRGEALRRVEEVFLSPGSTNWFQLTDEFYLHQRMRRWAGCLATADCLEQRTMNPMLDPRFLDTAMQLPAGAKHNLRFLARLLDRLDPELARIPLDARPAPVSYLRPTVADRAASLGRLAGKASRKVVQRVEHRTTAPEGGDVLAASILRHFRSEPSVLEPLTGLGILDPQWLDQIALGQATTTSGGVSMVMTLLAATMP